MKRIILAIAIIMLSAVGVSAQEFTAILNNVQTDAVIKGDFCKIDVHLRDIKNDGTAQVSIDITNNNSEYVYIFPQSIYEKTLKKKPYKIKFDSSYHPEDKGMRTVEGCNDIQRKLVIDPLYAITGVIKQEVYDAVPDQITIPVYSVRQIKKKKFITMSQKITIKLDVHLDAPQEFIAFKYDVEKLKADVDSLTFCGNPKHEPSLEQQKAKWQGKVNDLQRRYAQIVQNNEWSFTSTNRGRMIAKTEIYGRYEAVKAILDGINIENVPVKDCGLHVEEVVKPSHYCDYCSLKTNQIVDEVIKIYMMISNSDDPDSVRQQYASKVRQMENCAKRRGNYKDFQKIIDNYIDRINRE